MGGITGSRSEGAYGIGLGRKQRKKGMFRESMRAPFPLGTSATLKLPSLYFICLIEGPETLVHCHSSYSVRIYFSNFI